MENHIRSIALEQAVSEHPILAFSVNPGVMDTAMQADVRESKVEEFPDRERFVRLKLEGKLAQPDDVARRIVDLIDSRPEPGAAYPMSP
jgi:benzil reductase ((S)-benzoin forming)